MRVRHRVTGKLDCPGLPEDQLGFAAANCTPPQEQQVVEASGNESVQQSLQARQCKLRMLSLLCYGAGPLDDNEVASMLRLMVGTGSLCTRAWKTAKFRLPCNCSWLRIDGCCIPCT